MTPEDVRTVVSIHLTSFEGFFLSFLGAAFLRELYRAIVADPNGIAFVADEEGVTVGFVAGTSEPDGFYRRVARARWLRFAFAALPAFVRRPAILPRLARALHSPPSASMQRSALLMSIAVLPTVQGSGCGAALTDAFRNTAAARGAQAVTLTTDRVGNDAVNSFYVRRGFSLRRHFTTPEGREMNEYFMQLPDEDTP